MAPRLYKCYGTCNEKYAKDKIQKVGTQNFCEQCANEKVKEQKDRDILYKTIQTIYKIPYPNGQMLKQMKEFKDNRNYTYEGMTQTLCYIVKVQKITPSLRGALSILPYHYDNALIYYHELAIKREQTGEVNKEVIKIKMPPIKHSTEIFKNKRLVNMEGLK